MENPTERMPGLRMDGVDNRKTEEQEETVGVLLKQLDARFLLKEQIRKEIERSRRETTDPFVCADCRIIMNEFDTGVCVQKKPFQRIESASDRMCEPSPSLQWGLPGKIEPVVRN